MNILIGASAFRIEAASSPDAVMRQALEALESARLAEAAELLRGKRGGESAVSSANASPIEWNGRALALRGGPDAGGFPSGRRGLLTAHGAPPPRDAILFSSGSGSRTER